MEAPFQKLDSIVNGMRHPNRLYGTNDHKLKQMKDTIEFSPNPRVFIYSLKLPQPKNLFTHYYKKLIDLYKIHFIQQTIEQINNGITDDTKYYLLINALEGQIESLLLDCSKEIDKIVYPGLSDEKSDKRPKLEERDFPYIFEYLFYSLAHSYMELQDKFPEYLNEEKKDFEDFQLIYLEYAKKTLTPIFKKQIKDEPKKNKVAKESTSKHSDVLSKSFTYVHLDVNPNAILLFYESLKNQGFISEEDRTTSYKNFKKMFDGSDIDTIKAIIWRKDASSFANLIWLLHNELKLVKNMSQKQWKVAFTLFKNLNNQDFPYTTKKSINSATYGPMIIKAANCLKL